MFVCLFVGGLINVYCCSDLLFVEHCQFPLYWILWFWIVIVYFVKCTDFYKVLSLDLPLNLGEI
jgi:hypothetical protein